MTIEELKLREKYLNELYGICSKKLVFRVLRDLTAIRAKIKELENK
jgi:hypothetical protein